MIIIRFGSNRGLRGSRLGPVVLNWLAVVVVATMSWLALGVSEGIAAPQTLAIRSGDLVLTLDTKFGLGVRRIVRKTRDEETLILDAPQPRRLFQLRLAAGDKNVVIDSTAMRVIGLDGSSESGSITTSHEASHLRATLVYQRAAESEVDLELSLTSKENCEVHLVWPIIEGLFASAKSADLWYYHPRSSGIYHNIPADIASNYGQYVRLQMMAAFAPGNQGVYAIVKDTDLRRRSFELVKNVPGSERRRLHDEYGYVNWGGLAETPGAGMAVQTRRLSLQANVALELPPVAIGLTDKGMVGAIRAYRRWAATWYNPHRAPWFRRAFNYRSMRIFDAKTVDDVLDRIDGETIDLLHYMAQAKHVNGEYTYRHDWGAAGLRRLTAALNQRGILNSHYIEGYIAAKTSSVFLQHGDKWGQKRGGKNVVAFANMAMCQSVLAWREWLADVCVGLVRDLNFDVIYLDELGFGTLDKFVCDNPHHTHPPPFCGLRSTRALLRRVRERLRDVKLDTPLVTEGPAVDQLFTVLDGVQGYNCRDAFQLPVWYRTPVDWLRFFYPDFKFFDIPIGLPSERAWQLRRILFNGDGFLSGGHGPQPCRKLEERITRLYRENHDAFASDRVLPMLLTNHHGLFANQFDADRKQIVTLCNINEYPVAGELIDLAADGGQHFVELWRRREIHTRVVDGLHKLVLQIGPQDIGVVARLQRIIKVNQNGVWFKVSPVPQTLVQLARIDSEGDELSRHRIEPNRPFDLVQKTRQGHDRAVIRALADGLLLDQHELPALADINIARFAKATSSNPDTPHGKNAVAVNDSDIGASWCLRWDDPHPGWIQFTWSLPQRFNTCRYRYSRSEYSPRDSSLQYRDKNGKWITIIDKQDASDDRFDPVEANALRLLIRKGGRWANHVAMVDWQVRYEQRDGH